jgi:hypothetical protein
VAPTRSQRSILAIGGPGPNVLASRSNARQPFYGDYGHDHLPSAPDRETEGTSRCAGGQSRCQPQPLDRDAVGHPCRRPGRSRTLFRRPRGSGQAGDGAEYPGTGREAAAASGGRSIGCGVRMIGVQSGHQPSGDPPIRGLRQPIEVLDADRAARTVLSQLASFA